METLTFHSFNQLIIYPIMSCLSEIRISKLESFGCAKKNASGPVLKNIQKQLNLIYVNNDEHTHMDRSNGSTGLQGMAFTSPSLGKHDIQFQIGDDSGGDHLPIEISIDAPPRRNSSVNHTKYKFDQTDRDFFLILI